MAELGGCSCVHRDGSFILVPSVCLLFSILGSFQLGFTRGKRLETAVAARGRASKRDWGSSWVPERPCECAEANGEDVLVQVVEMRLA